MSKMETSTAVVVALISGVATAIFGSTLAYFLLKQQQETTTTTNSETTNHVTEEEEEEFIDYTTYPGGRLTIFFGSQTGTAIEFSKALSEEAEEAGFSVKVVDLEDVVVMEDDDVNLERLYRTLHYPNRSGSNTGSTCDDKHSMNINAKAVFLMSTYGEGDPTDNAMEFVKLLKKKKTQKNNNCILENLDYSVFALGNTDYEHYNACGKFVDEALEKLGAKRIVTLGLGDDNEDIEADFQKWKDDDFWPKMKEIYLKTTKVDERKKKKSSGKNRHLLPELPFEVKYLDKKSDYSGISTIAPDQISSFTKHYFTAVECPIVERRELCSSDSGRSTLHIEIDISGQNDNGLQYQTADNLAILPVNDKSLVGKLAISMGYDLDTVVQLVKSPSYKSTGDFKHMFPNPCTIEELLSCYCDLTAPPRRSELKHLIPFAQDKLDRQALKRLSSKEGKTEYKSKILDQHVGLVDIITKYCPSLQIPIDHFIEVCPRLHPRYYTISSSSSMHPNKPHITVAVLKHERDDGSTFKGVCSNFLVDAKQCKVFCRDSTFRLPKDPSIPIIMVGPGTGIAPMRGFLQERSFQRNNNNKSRSNNNNDNSSGRVSSSIVGETILYFGCRSRVDDYLYKEELEEFKQDGTLTKLFLAFSREKQRGGEKEYVQHLLKENAKETWDLIHKHGAYMYICGGTKMGHDVVNTLTEIFAQEGHKSPDEAQLFLKNLEGSGRLVQELWS